MAGTLDRSRSGTAPHLGRRQARSVDRADAQTHDLDLVPPVEAFAGGSSRHHRVYCSASRTACSLHNRHEGTTTTSDPTITVGPDSLCRRCLRMSKMVSILATSVTPLTNHRPYPPGYERRRQLVPVSAGPAVGADPAQNVDGGGTGRPVPGARAAPAWLCSRSGTGVPRTFGAGHRRPAIGNARRGGNRRVRAANAATSTVAGKPGPSRTDPMPSPRQRHGFPCPASDPHRRR